MSDAHPLATTIRAAAIGTFPAVDGAFEVIPPWRAGVNAVVDFTGHSFIATTRPYAELAALGADGFGSAMHPRVLLHLAGANGWIDSLDTLTVARGTGLGDHAIDQGSDRGNDQATVTLLPRPGLATQSRARHAASVRDDVHVFGLADATPDREGLTDTTLVTLSNGIAGLPELSIELDPCATVRGREVIRAALGLVPAGELVIAAIAPGNARSLRAFLACGFTPIGSIQLVRSQQEPANARSPEHPTEVPEAESFAT